MHWLSQRKVPRLRQQRFNGRSHAFYCALIKAEGVFYIGRCAKLLRRVPANFTPYEVGEMGDETDFIGHFF